MAKRPHYRPYFDELSAAERRAVRDGVASIPSGFERISFDRWMNIARAVAPLVRLAARPGMSRDARATFLQENGYGGLDPATVRRLVVLAEHEDEIRDWRKTLTPSQREAWSSPASVYNRCPALVALRLG